jgi:hypothetical protein
MKAARIDGRSFAALPAVVSGLFPTLVCPGCWPTYTAFLSALGLPFIPTGDYLFPVTGGFLAIAVIALAFGRRRSHRSGPLLLGVIGSVVVVVGRFLLAVQAVAYMGAVLLLGASMWNSTPRRGPAPVCGNCSSKTQQIEKEI